ncbi:MAG: D-alanyl-D-alanine dipeptidase [Verrucomicrobiota bacterium]
MRKLLIFILLLSVVSISAVWAQVEERPAPHFLRVDRALPSVIVIPRYATDNNITGKPIYESEILWVHRDTVRALKKVVRRLKDKGYRLVIWDAYRPPFAQWELWKAYPDPEYVADPRKFSRHSRGTSVDISLADRDGNLLEMATDFDEFTSKADHDLEDLTPEIRERVHFLRTAMFDHGFRGVPAEWWHYDLKNWPDYPVVMTDRDKDLPTSL